VKPASLSGRRIVITRAQRQSGGLRERLESQGAEVLLLPTIETVAPESYAPLDDALHQAAQFDWLVVTSRNSVDVIHQRLAALGLSRECLAHLKCAAVGPSTADGLKELGLRADLVPEQYVGEALASELVIRVGTQRVLLVLATGARSIIPDALRKAGATVTIAHAYRTVVPADAAARAKAIFGARPLPDAVVFTSGSTVIHLLNVLSEAELALPDAVACISIGPVTSAALRDVGLAVAAEAATASLEGLVAACVGFLAR
jgi:uroporphyrinogen-III synthase